MSNKILMIIPPSTLFPIGWAYVAAVLNKMKLDYDVFGFYHDRSLWNNSAWTKSNTVENNYSSPPVQIPVSLSEQELFNKVIANKYEYIFVGGLVGYFKWWYRFLPLIKNSSPESKIIIGGGITKNLPAKMLFDKLSVDYILKGEAEVNLEEFMTAVKAGKTSDDDFSDISGLCWIDNSSKIRINPVRRLDISKVDTAPAWESLNAEEFINRSAGFPIPGKTNFTVLIGRGCPNVCSFCSPTIGRHVPGNLDFVFKELKRWVDTFDFDYFSVASEVAFTDDEQTNTFCERYITEINIPWVAQLRTDIRLADETYQNLVEAGCKFVSFGFESANDRILKMMRKDTSLSDHLRNIIQAKEAGLTVSGSFIFGNETETIEEMRETFEFIRDNDLLTTPFVGMNALVIYPGTEYFRNALKKNQVEDTFEFLLTYSNKSGICDVDLRNLSINARVNISAVEDDDFYNLLAEETIKTHHHFQENHELENIELECNLGEHPGLEFAGKCPHCGAAAIITAQDYNNPFNVSKTCSKCYFTIYVPLFELAELKDFAFKIREFLADKKRVIIVGEHLMDIIYNSTISIDYSKIIAWYNHHTPEKSEKEYFYNKPQIRKGELKDSNADAIITVGRIDNVHEMLDVDKSIPAINILPSSLKDYFLKELLGRKVAVISNELDSALNVDLKTFCEVVVNYSSIDELNAAEVEYDYIVCDDTDDGVGRNELAMKSKYQLSKILSSEFLS